MVLKVKCNSAVRLILFGKVRDEDVGGLGAGAVTANGLFGEIFLGPKGFGFRGRFDEGVGAVLVEFAGLGVVVELGFEDGVQRFLGFGIFDGGKKLDAFAEVAVHEVGAGDEDHGMAALAEPKDAGVFEVAVDDADDADVFAEAFDAGTQTADATDAEEDLDAGFAGGVEGVDHLGIFKGIHLQHHAGRFAVAGAFGFAFDEFDKTFAQAEGGHADLVEVDEARPASDGVEEGGGIGTVLRAAGEVGDVGVEFGRGLVVVAGAEVAIAHHTAGFATHDEGDFGVGFESTNAVDDLGSGVEKVFGAFKVAGFVEAGA